MTSPAKTVPTIFPKGSPVGRLWEDVKAAHAKEPGGSAAFEQRVNRGYFTEPEYFPRFINDTAHIETQEVFEHCYSHPDCYPILAKHGFPVHFAMNDFDEIKWFDDQVRFGINRGVDHVKGELKIKHPSWTQSTSHYCRVLASGVFDWVAETLPFNQMCPGEFADWEAALGKCGKCTERTDIGYYIYQRAGLGPQFLVISGQEPSRNWVNMAREGSTISGHVLLRLAGCSGRDIQVDFGEGRFDAKYPQAQVISPRNYELLVLQNKLAEHAARQDVEGLRRTLKTIRTIAPEDFFSAFMEMRLDIQPGAGGIAALSEIERQFPDHPAAQFLRKFFVTGLINGKDALLQIETEESELAGLLRGMEKDNPRLAAKVHSVIAETTLITIAFERARTPPDVMRREGLERMGYPITAVVHHLAAAIALDPMAYYSFYTLYVFTKDWQEILPPEVVIAICEAALEKRPDHVPLHYMAGSYVLKTIKKMGGNDMRRDVLLMNAEGHLRRIAELEPKNPMAYTDHASALFRMKRWEEADRVLDKAKEVSKDRPPLQYYLVRLSIYSSTGRIEDYRAALKDMIANYPKEVPDVIEELFSNLEWSLAGKSNTVDSFYAVGMGVFTRLHDVIETTLELLRSFPRAYAVVQQKKASLAPLAVMCKEEAEWKAWFQTIPDVRSPDVMKEFENGLSFLGAWLASSFLQQEVADKVEQKLELLRRSLPPEFNDMLLVITTELVNNYIRNGRTPKAEALFVKLLDRESTTAVISYVNRVANLVSFTMVEKLAAFDILYRHRDRLAPELRRRIRDAYGKIILAIASDPALSKRIPEIKKRMEKL